jgi:hypothetical protein
MVRNMRVTMTLEQDGFLAFPRKGARRDVEQLLTGLNVVINCSTEDTIDDDMLNNGVDMMMMMMMMRISSNLNYLYGFEVNGFELFVFLTF